jgi:hypothetical protein
MITFGRNILSPSSGLKNSSSSSSMCYFMGGDVTDA